MSIRITGYDIVNEVYEPGDQVFTFQGVVHLEENRNPVDIPFEGTKLKSQLGFNQLFFKDPDEVENQYVKEQADEILDHLTDLLHVHGIDTGEYRVTRTIK